MTKIVLIGIVAFLLSVPGLPVVRAQGIAGAAGLYDPQTVVTLTGTVIAKRAISPAEIATGGVVLVLQTASETVSVYVYPQSYIADIGFQVQVNDPNVTVTGSRIAFNNNTVIIAAVVSNPNSTFRIRDTASGMPFF